VGDLVAVEEAGAVEAAEGAATGTAITAAATTATRTTATANEAVAISPLGSEIPVAAWTIFAPTDPSHREIPPGEGVSTVGVTGDRVGEVGSGTADVPAAETGEEAAAAVLSPR
jgi:hypothetical protein